MKMDRKLIPFEKLKIFLENPDRPSKFNLNSRSCITSHSHNSLIQGLKMLDKKIQSNSRPPSTTTPSSTRSTTYAFRSNGKGHHRSKTFNINSIHESSSSSSSLSAKFEEKKRLLLEMGEYGKGKPGIPYNEDYKISDDEIYNWEYLYIKYNYNAEKPYHIRPYKSEEYEKKLNEFRETNHKEGPIESGIHKDFHIPDYDIRNDKTDIFKERLYYRHKTDDEYQIHLNELQRNEGPLQIGINKEYQFPNYEIDDIKLKEKNLFPEHLYFPCSKVSVSDIDLIANTIKSLKDDELKNSVSTIKNKEAPVSYHGYKKWIENIKNKAQEPKLDISKDF